MPEPLIFVPTAAEANAVRKRLEPSSLADTSVQLCGFGPIAAAARTMQVLSGHRPERIFLVGIAGGFGEASRVGEALVFDDVAIYGIGAGTGTDHISAGEMGWAHWAGDGSSEDPPIGDSIPLRSTIPSAKRQLLTVCAASANEHEVNERLEKFPHAVAEDMEGFGVAMSCRLADVPLTIIRGISNVAGDRDKSNWRIVEALNAAADLLLDELE